MSWNNWEKLHKRAMDSLVLCINGKKTKVRISLANSLVKIHCQGNLHRQGLSIVIYIDILSVRYVVKCTINKSNLNHINSRSPIRDWGPVKAWLSSASFTFCCRHASTVSHHAVHRRGMRRAHVPPRGARGHVGCHTRGHGVVHGPAVGRLAVVRGSTERGDVTVRRSTWGS